MENKCKTKKILKYSWFITSMILIMIYIVIICLTKKYIKNNDVNEKNSSYKFNNPKKGIINNFNENQITKVNFKECLSTFSTKFNIADSNRNENIKISAEKINNIILMPGEEFSYNKVLGERSKEAGYKQGISYIGGKAVSDYGGGVCQTASTLYNAILLANLEVVSRTSHYFQVGYVPAGRDATVYWPNLDFRFKNNRKYPIKISTNIEYDSLKIDIFGTKEDNEYEVQIESNITSYIPISIKYEYDNNLTIGKEILIETGTNGIRSETYKIIKKNNNIILKTLISRDIYNGKQTIIKIGTKTK